MKTYAGRFVLPAILLMAACAVWIVGARLGGTTAAPTVVVADTAADVPLVSLRRLPEFAAASLSADAVSAALATLPSDPGGLSCTSLLVDGVPALRVRNDQPLIPSFAQLVITGHAALDVLGSDYEFETRVMAFDEPDEDGRVAGGIYLVGGGDPVLMTAGYSRGFTPVRSTRTSLETLAALVVAAGVQRVDGNVIAVESRYDDQRGLPGWPEEYLSPSLVGSLTALQVNDGLGSTSEVGPAVAAALRFDDLLEDLDVRITDSARLIDADEDLTDAQTIARISSPPLGDIVLQMMAANDAGAAELLVKELATRDGDIGTTQAGARVVQQVLQDQGVAVDVPFRDGSGVDPIGGTTCDQLAITVDTIPDGHPTLDALPSFDLPGVADGRLQSIDLVADLRAVGGVQGDASGLVARTVDDGRRVTIASIVNRPNGPLATDLAYQDALIGLVDELRSGIEVEALGAD